VESGQFLCLGVSESLAEDVGSVLEAVILPEQVLLLLKLEQRDSTHALDAHFSGASRFEKFIEPYHRQQVFLPMVSLGEIGVVDQLQFREPTLDFIQNCLSHETPSSELRVERIPGVQSP
jgi:hypothetical protein